MHTEILSPKKLFQKEVRYVIPPFQRPYVWSLDDQWGPMWEDVRNVAEGYLEALERSGNDEVKAESETTPHFLGAIVLRQVSTATKDLEQREVIDGQQRVTTLQLLLDAIQQVCEGLDQPYAKSAGRRLSKLVTNDKELITEGHHVFKLWPTHSDQQAFRHAMDNGLAVDDFANSLIVQAHEFFQLQIREWLGEVDESTKHKIDALEAAATNMLQIVVIDLDTQEDPNLIFETLNARGTPLEESDLVKNYVLSGGQALELWGNLDDRWWREEVRQGRIRRPRLDMLLNHWLAMRTSAEVASANVFNAFRTYASAQGIGKVMTDVKRDLANYREYDTTRGDNIGAGLFYHRMSVMEAGVITPVLLLLLSAEQEPRQRALGVLESFLVRRMICRQSTMGFNRLVIELVNQLHEGGLENVDRTTAEFLKEQKAPTRVWPTDEDVSRALISSPIYRLLTRGRLRLILEGVEGWLRSSGKSGDTTVPGNLTIEHLMPMGWKTEEWPLPSGADDGDARYRRNGLIHTVGNLTLTTQQLNSSMSNDAWEAKQQELSAHATLLLNRDLVPNDSWDEESIVNRSRWTANVVLQVWPRPIPDA
jgi:hypothetical protein